MSYQCRYVLGFFLSVLPFTTNVLAETQADIKSQFSKSQLTEISDRVVLIAFAQDDNTVAYGTAFFVSPEGHMLSNYHVLSRCISDLGREDGVVQEREICPEYIAIKNSDWEKSTLKNTLGSDKELLFDDLVALVHAHDIPSSDVSIISNYGESMAFGAGEKSLDIVLGMSTFASNAYFAPNFDLPPFGQKLWSFGFSAPYSLDSRIPEQHYALEFADFQASFSAGYIHEDLQDGFFLSGTMDENVCSPLTKERLLINFGGSGSPIFDANLNLVGIAPGSWNCVGWGDYHHSGTIVISAEIIFSSFYDELEQYLAD